jgi:hypothetical protein
VHIETMKLSRQAVATAGITAVVTAAIFASVSIQRSQASPTPTISQRGGSTVTVAPPGPHSPADEIAQGTVNGKTWSLTESKPVKYDGELNLCFQSSGSLWNISAMSSGYMGTCETDFSYDYAPGTPANLTGFWPNPPYVGSNTADLIFGPVGPEVTDLTVALTNGTALTLRPVAVYGTRYVAFAAPRGTIRSVTAHSSRGEPAKAIPFNGAYGYGFWDWLKPGQHGFPAASHVLASGTDAGVDWSASVYLGPWGICGNVTDPFTQAGGGDSPACWANPTGNKQTAMLENASGPAGNLMIGAATPGVTRIVVSLPGGKTEAVRLVRLDGFTFWGFGYPEVVHWTAYDAAGKAVATGTT